VGYYYIRHVQNMQKHTIKEWFVKLKGAEHDLNELPSVFNIPFVTVMRLKDGFYLKSAELNNLKDAGEVFKSSKRLIEMVNGTAKLHFDHYGQVEIDNSITGIDESGHTYGFSFGCGTGRKINETYEDPARVRKWLTKAIQEKNVADMLRFFSDQNWFNLYKIYELVRAEAGDVARHGWVTKRELDRFTQTAQSQESIGDAARHAAIKKYKPHEDPMSLIEAKSFIKDLLLNWFSSSTK